MPSERIKVLLVEHNPGDARLLQLTLEDETVGDKEVREGAQDYLVKEQVDSKLLVRCWQ